MHTLLPTSYLKQVIELLSDLRQDSKQLDRGIDVIERAWKRGNQIITCGNGGSAVTAQHFITDWGKMLTRHTAYPFYGRCLVDNIGIITAHGNDDGFDDIFALQMPYVARPNDLLVAISGSGNSKDVLNAVSWANDNAVETLGLCGYDGGLLKKRVGTAVHIPVWDMQMSEDAFTMFGHMVLRRLMP